MNSRSRSRKARSLRSACPRCWVFADCDLAAAARSRRPVISDFCRLPFGEPGTDHDRLDDPHDLVAVGVVRPELRALVRVETALEQRAQDRGVDLRPVERRRLERRLDLGLLQRQGGIVVEQPAVEPCHRLETDKAAGRHRPEQGAGHGGEFLGLRPRLLQHAGEHVGGQQAHVLREHAEHQTVDEMRHRLRLVATLAQRLRQHRERRRRALGQRLPALAGPETFGIGHRPLELVAGGGVREIVEPELVGQAHAVGPVGADAEPHHVRDDQQRRVLQRQRVLPELIEGGVEIGVLALVLPREAVPLPHVGPAVAAGVLARASLEAVVPAGGVGLGRRRLAEQPAQIDEMLLRRGALLQLRRPPLGDELTGCHVIEITGASSSWRDSEVFRRRAGLTAKSDSARSTLPALLPHRGARLRRRTSAAREHCHGSSDIRRAEARRRP